MNNAGWDIFKPFIKSTPDEWQKLIQINLVGMLNMHFAVLKGMVERNSGSIVNIASDAARVGSSGEAVYAACKEVCYLSPKLWHANIHATTSKLM